MWWWWSLFSRVGHGSFRTLSHLLMATQTLSGRSTMWTQILFPPSTNFLFHSCCKITFTNTVIEYPPRKEWESISTAGHALLIVFLLQSEACLVALEETFTAALFFWSSCLSGWPLLPVSLSTIFENSCIFWSVSIPGSLLPSPLLHLNLEWWFLS